MPREISKTAQSASEQVETHLPEWYAFADSVIATWDHNEFYLRAAVALGLKQAYEYGKSGKPTPQEFLDKKVILAPQEPTEPKLLRRTRTAPAKPTVIRRSRPDQR